MDHIRSKIRVYLYNKMSEKKVISPFYYSAPRLVSQIDVLQYNDPLMSIPGLNDREERPGDLFRGAASLTRERPEVTDPKSLTRFRAGKLNWPFG